MSRVRSREAAATGRRRVSVLLGAAAVMLLLVLPALADAQRGRTPTPSADELWQDYPLHEQPSEAGRPVAPAAKATPRPAAPAGGGTAHRGRSLMDWVLIGLLIVVVIVAVAIMVSPATQDARDQPEDAAPRPRPADRAPGVVPPDPHRPWTAEVEWRPAGSGARFRALARAPEG